MIFNVEWVEYVVVYKGEGWSMVWFITGSGWSMVWFIKGRGGVWCGL